MRKIILSLFVLVYHAASSQTYWNTAGNTNPGGYILGTTGGNFNLDIKNGAAYPINFWTGGSQKATILSTGEFIVGAPSVLSGEFVSLQKSFNGWAGLRVYNADNNSADHSASASFGATSVCSGGTSSINLTEYNAYYSGTGMFEPNAGVINTNGVGGMNIGTNTNYRLALWTNNTKRMTIDNVGNVGIGPNPPGGKLDISAAGGNFIFDGSGSGGYTTRILMDNTGLKIGHNSTVRDIEFSISSTTVMTISQLGNVGIGTINPNPTYKLDVNGLVRANEVRVCAFGTCDFVFDKKL